MSSISKRAIASRQAALDRTELRSEAALRRYAQEQLIKDARFARALAQEGIELVEEGLERVGAKRVSAS